MTVQQYVGAARSKSTNRTYALLNNAWARWCEERGHDPYPPDPERFMSYLVWRNQLGDAYGTLVMRRAALRALCRAEGHPDTLSGKRLTEFFAGLANTHGVRARQQAAGITADVYRDISAEFPEDHWLLGLIGMMRDGLLRRSEAAAARWEDLTPMHDGSARLLIRRSKTDQKGTGYVTYVSAPTMEHLDAIERKGERIFSCSGRTISRKVAKAARAVGVEGASGHSMRVGMAMDLASAGAGMAEIMQAGRWRTVQMVSRYTANIQAGDNAVARWHQGGGK